MTAALNIIQDLRVAGIAISRDGGMIVLDGPEDAMTDELVASLRSLKPEIIAYLRDTAACWSQDNWQMFFDERANFAQRQLGYDRSSAELCAFEDCVDHWLILNPPKPIPSTQCILCRQPILPQDTDPIPVAAGVEIGTLHSACSGKWMVSRRWEARRALLWLFGRHESLMAREPNLKLGEVPSSHEGGIANSESPNAFLKHRAGLSPNH